MILKKWTEMPDYMKCEEVKVYYDILMTKKISLIVKRIFDFLISLSLLLILCIPILIIALLVKLESPGSVFFRQERVTTYGKIFRIHKFRTMVENAEKIGSAVTVPEDQRITRVGKVIRKYRLDELPQLIDVLFGNMSFVGTRPEIVRYVEKYSDEMKATLLLPAGITNSACIEYKKEDKELKILESAQDIDKAYIDEVLPGKMRYNLEDIKKFSCIRDLKIMVSTLFVVFREN